MTSTPPDPPTKRHHDDAPKTNRKYQRIDYQTPSEAPFLGGKTGLALAVNSPAPKFHQTYAYGNYKNYYENRRNPTKHHDTRLDLLDVSLFNDKRVLDIGCNSGNITLVIGQHYHPTYILGVDIDESLIHKAKQQTKIAAALAPPSTFDHHHQQQQHPIDIGMRFSYFPKSMPRMFGYTALTLPPTADTTQFPLNTAFETADWMEVAVKANDYDTVMALSITKWIQLHRGDEGIKEFFRKVYRCLKPKGTFVLEPQPFTTYERRAKQDPATKDIFESLVFRPEHYEGFLIELGFSSVQHLGPSSNDNKGFQRPLSLYIK
ncbi:Bicoid-interacting protein 3-domain-containing protein [Spinellus fusiger]|nr:Bicoid-interacting protein 3-domain-containing protein [Spinellus fusiger]